jgi:hypothetical protein
MEFDFRAIERQYQGSVDQRNADVIEIETRKRPVSIVTKLDDTEPKEEQKK